MENDEPGAESHPYVNKGICENSDEEGEHRDLYVMMAHSEEEIYLKQKPGDLGSRNSYPIN